MNEVKDNPEKSRIELLVDGQVAGFEDYEYEDGADVISYVHTEVDEAYAGQGLARVLVDGALGLARERGLFVRPVCPYVRRVIERDKEHGYLELVRPEDRAEFDLPA